jgi:hypothetical protein
MNINTIHRRMARNTIVSTKSDPVVWRLSRILSAWQGASLPELHIRLQWEHLHWNNNLLWLPLM